MGVRENYRANVTQSVLIDFLQQLKVPSEPMINSRVEDLLLVSDPENPEVSMRLDLSRPILSQKNFKFTYKEPLSASRINSLMGAIYSDLNVLYDTALQIEKGHLSSVERTLKDLSEIEREIEGLLSEVNRILLVTEETEGTLSIVGDNFEDNTLIDYAATTANIDRDRQVVTIAPLTGINTPTSGIDLTLANVSISSLTRGIQGNIHNFRGMLDSTPAPSEISLLSQEPISAVVSFVIDMTNVLVNGTARPKEVSGVSIVPSTLGRTVDILVQYSLDGIDWKPLPVAEPSRRTSGIVNYTFPKTSLNFLKIFASKVNYDTQSNNNYYYNFGISRLIVLDQEKDLQSSSTLQSVHLIPTGLDGVPVLFTRAIISEVCYERPPNTSIDFYLSMLVRDNQGDLVPTEFQKISPFQDVDQDGIAATVADVETLDNVTVSGVKIMPQAHEWAEFGQLDTSYRGRGTPGKGVLVTQIADGGSLVKASSEEESVEVWRNVGEKDSNRSVYNERMEILPAGWSLNPDTGSYSTYIDIQDRAGVTIDFGNYSIIIDSVETQGVTFLSYGVHKVEIFAENWMVSKDGFAGATSYDILSKTFQGSRRRYGDTGTGDNIVIAENESMLDRFYPYNQRLLIEGLDYHSEDFLGEKVYLGVGLYAAHYAEQVSAFDLESSAGSEYDKFAIVDVIEGIAQNSVRSYGLLMNLVQMDSTQNRELLTIAMRPTDATVAEGVIFKAVLNTEDRISTPSLEGYEIKMVR